MENLGFSPNTGRNKGIPMGFDSAAYDSMQAQLETARKALHEIQKQTSTEQVLKKAYAERQEAKNKYAQSIKQRVENTQKHVEQIFSAYNTDFENQFRQYKPEPAPVDESTLKPETLSGFSSNTASMESKWSAKKTEDKPQAAVQPEKKSWFKRVFGKTEAPQDPAPTVNTGVLKRPEEQAMPHWAKVALSKAKQIDTQILQSEKNEASGWVNYDLPKVTPSFMKQPQQPQSKQSWFGKAKSWLGL